MKLFRGIKARSTEEAWQFIKSTEVHGLRMFGEGMYFTDSKENAERYGNYIFAVEVPKNCYTAAKGMPAIPTYIMTNETYEKMLDGFELILEDTPEHAKTVELTAKRSFFSKQSR